MSNVQWLDNKTGKKNTERKKPRPRISRFKISAVINENNTMQVTWKTTNVMVL